MLVLSRREQEAVEFPELGVVIRVVSLKKSKVQLGIEAPRRIKISRSECMDPLDKGGNPAGRWDPNQMNQRMHRLEAQISALAELAGRSNRDLANQVAGDALDQLARIQRLLVSPIDAPSGSSSVDQSELDRAHKRLPVDEISLGENVDPNSLVKRDGPSRGHACVRQDQAGFTIGARPEQDLRAVSYRRESSCSVKRRRAPVRVPVIPYRANAS